MATPNKEGRHYRISSEKSPSEDTTTTGKHNSLVREESLIPEVPRSRIWNVYLLTNCFQTCKGTRKCGPYTREKVIGGNGP